LLVNKLLTIIIATKHHMLHAKAGWKAAKETVTNHKARAAAAGIAAQGVTSNRLVSLG